MPVDEIERLIEERRAARSRRDFTKADEIRHDLDARGIILEDSAGGTRWKREVAVPKLAHRLHHLLLVPTVHQSQLGELGEDAACRELRRRGYVILARRYRTRHGELDIIAREGDVLVFVEVKTRSSHAFGGPLHAVTGQKTKEARPNGARIHRAEPAFGGCLPFRCRGRAASGWRDENRSGHQRLWHPIGSCLMGSETAWYATRVVGSERE